MNNILIFLLAIILTGSTGYNSRSVEILREEGSSLCTLPDLPDDFNGHTQTGPIACGGSYHQSSCYIFSGVWNQSHTLRYDRYYHSAWMSPLGLILLGGTGEDSVTNSELLSDEFNNSTELFSLRYYTEYDISYVSEDLM